MHDLVSDMTHRDPAKRPLIEEVVVRFARICESLSGLKLRSPITSKKQLSLFTAFVYARQAIRSFYYVVSNSRAPHRTVLRVRPYNVRVPTGSIFGYPYRIQVLEMVDGTVRY